MVPSVSAAVGVTALMTIGTLMLALIVLMVPRRRLMWYPKAPLDYP
jgi:hypothetical protein